MGDGIHRETEGVGGKVHRGDLQRRACPVRAGFEIFQEVIAMQRVSILALAGAFGAGLVVSSRSFASHEPMDFNGDGYGDIAVGVPGEDLGGIQDAGGINVIYGSSAGPTSKGNQFWSLNTVGIQGESAGGDGFGAALAVGDFDGDGYADLAVGVPFSDASGQTDGGAILVLYGSNSGLSSNENQLYHRAADSGADDRLGSCLVAADFNGDGYADLAVAAPYDDVNNRADAGSVWILRGSQTGLSTSSSQFLAQGLGGISGTLEAGDLFGSSLAVGNFGRGSDYDLAIGVPGEDLGSATDAGGVNVIYGSSTGLASAGNQFWTQNTSKVPDKAETGDQFGFALAAGDFNGNGYDDLAVGTPFEDLPAATPAADRTMRAGIAAAGGIDSGWVCVLPGSVKGLQGNDIIELGFTPEGGDPGDAAQFGSALAAGDANGDNLPDIAIGALEATADGFNRSGAVNVILSTINGLAGGDVIVITPSDAYPAIISFENAEFGKVVTWVDTQDAFPRQLVVGSPGLAVDGKAGAGRAAAIDLRQSEFKILDLSQNTAGIKDKAEPFDSFGRTVALPAALLVRAPNAHPTR